MGIGSVRQYGDKVCETVQGHCRRVRGQGLRDSVGTWFIGPCGDRVCEDRQVPCRLCGTLINLAYVLFL